MEMEYRVIVEDKEFVSAFLAFCKTAHFVAPEEANFWLMLRDKFLPLRVCGTLTTRLANLIWQITETADSV